MVVSMQSLAIASPTPTVVDPFAVEVVVAENRPRHFSLGSARVLLLPDHRRLANLPSRHQCSVILEKEEAWS